MKPLSDCRLYTFVDTAYLQSATPETVARELCDGGSDLIQLRAKNSSPAEVLRLAERLLPIVERAGVGLVINDYPAIATAVGAPLCHLGQEDFFGEGYSQVSQVLAAHPIESPRQRLQFGLSTHAPRQAAQAIAAGANYIAIGPVFPTGTKPTAQAVTLDYVRWASAHVLLPWFAIGGITLQNLDSVLEAGARRICAVSSVLTAPDRVRACQMLKERILSAGRDPAIT
jgi:thiamine-phosphate pyrophosphorylase